MHLTKKIALATGAAFLCLGLAGCGTTQASPRLRGSQQKMTRQVKNHNVSAGELAQLNYKPKQADIVTVNHNHSTLSKRQWKHDGVFYHRLDRERRASGANVATIDRANLAHDTGRKQQTVRPTGWHQRFVNGQAIINRGHMIAYSLSGHIGTNGRFNRRVATGDQNNPKNLFTQTAFSNQQLQAIYEQKVRQALQRNKKVIFSVQPVFQGRDQMAKGVHMMALSTDHKLNFNVYIFNVQQGVKFNYKNGTSTNDRNMRLPKLAHPISYGRQNKSNNWRRGRRGNWNRRGRRHSGRRFVRDAAVAYGWHKYRQHRRNKWYRKESYYRRPIRRRSSHYHYHYHRRHAWF